MTAPTREQIEAAREHFKRMIRLGCLLPDTATHAETLISATAELTDEELAQEVADWSPKRPLTYASAYRSGARREGAR